MYNDEFNNNDMYRFTNREVPRDDYAPAPRQENTYTAPVRKQGFFHRTWVKVTALVLACAEITERAEIELDCALNPNLPFTLADHLNFAAERLRKGIEISTPLAYDVRHLYPKETELAKQARELLAREAGLKLPDSEVVNIALHLINAEAEAGDMHSMMVTLKALSDVDGIVEKQLDITLNKESFSYSRFSMHLRYLIQRLASGRQVEERISGMLAQMRREYPQVYQCARAIADYFQATWNWQCNDEEIVYLMLHISRLQEKHEA